ncbi:S41 family peptidase [Candidatus Bipolaricaulota bacterium]|nr:S41 family peptidase [Candidatus Bipolaricaulota bacterium]
MKRVLLLSLALVGLVAVAANQSSDLFSPLGDVYRLIQTYYYRADQVTDEQLLHGALRGMIEALDDPYSAFLDPEEYSRWQESLEGEYSGVGMEITIRDGKVTVVSPLPGTPAEQAGIRPGDWIRAVDGRSTEGWTLEEASMAIRGEEGTQVTLTVQHPDGTVEEITIVRARIHVDPVRAEYWDEKKVGYVRVLRFDFETPAQVGQALYSFPLHELKGVILDLRYNPGGVLSAAVDVASFFIDEGIIVRTSGPSFGAKLYGSKGNSFPNLPLVVLVNEGTASASEIVAGAIQDHGVGVLVGRNTFGKGLIQEFVMRLPDGSAIKLTTGEYFTPKGRPVQDVGLAPDIPVEEEGEGADDPDIAAALEWIASQAAQPVGSP